jgi:hypothetical protein
LAEGAAVVLVSKNPDINAAAVCELGKLDPSRVLGVPTDLADDSAIAAMTAQVLERYGRIDILVNSAATVIPQDFFKMDDGHLTALLEEKFNPAARCIRHAVPDMRKRKWGRIINISGLAGRQPHYTVVPAALNNSAMLNLTKDGNPAPPLSSPCCRRCRTSRVSAHRSCRDLSIASGASRRWLLARFGVRHQCPPDRPIVVGAARPAIRGR